MTPPAMTSGIKHVSRRRHGSVLIMVVALLVLLALMGSAYIITARLDRQASVPLTQIGTLNETIDGLLNGQKQALITTITRETGAHTGYPSATAFQRWLSAATPTIIPQYFPANNTAAGGSADSYLVATAGQLVPSPAANHFNPAGAHQIALHTISRPPIGTPFVSPLNITNPGTNYYEYGHSASNATVSHSGVANQDDGRWWYLPTYVAIQYDATAIAQGVSPELLGRTRIFPAFNRLRFDTGDKVEVDINGPYLAADSTGWGIADSGLIPITQSSINGINYYVSYRVVDNSASFNLNVHWTSESDIDSNGNGPYNFFPSAINAKSVMPDWNGLSPLASATLPYSTLKFTKFSIEYDHPLPQNGTRTNHGLTSYWWPANAVAPRFGTGNNPITDTGGARNDMIFRTPAEALWSQYHSRLDYAGRFSSATPYGKGTAYPGARAFSATDDNSYRGGLINQNSPRSTFQNVVYDAGVRFNVPDAFYRMAPNYVASTSNEFKFFTPADTSYWFDSFYNWEGIVEPTWTNKLPGPGAPFYGTNYARTQTGVLRTFTQPPVPNNDLGVNGLVYRNPSPLFTSYSPVANRADLSTTIFTDIVANANYKFCFTPTTPSHDFMAKFNGTAHPKVSLNTAQFKDLWRGFMFAMIDGADTASGKAFKVPGQADTNPNFVKGTFRNAIRSTDGTGDSDSSNGWTTAWDSHTMVLLRSAIAATNAIDIRDSDGMTGTQKTGNTTTKIIELNPTSTGAKYNVRIYGNEAQPFITEVFANTDTITEDGTMKKNIKGFIAVELFNPYSVPIKLKNYKLAVAKRKSGSPLTLTAINTGTDLNAITIPANGFVVLTNFNSTGGDKAERWINYVTWPATVSMPATDWHSVKGLADVLDDGSGNGGELYLMRPHITDTATASNTRWNEANIDEMVPADSFDFTGLSTGNTAEAHDWHYSRIADITPKDAWKCVYPGKYTMNTATGTPRNAGVHVSAKWDPTAPKNEKDSWEPAGDPGNRINFGKVKPIATYTNDFPGIRLNNFDWADSTSPTNKSTAAGPNRYPFGGFPRLGDILQVPFIGAYMIKDSSGKLIDITPITMDSLFVDDQYDQDDAIEQLGRFCPLRLNNATGNPLVDDYSGSTTINYNKTTTPHLAYHWASKVFDQFTVIGNPHDDYLPNIDPGLDPDFTGNFRKKYPGPTPVAQHQTPTANGTSEEMVPVEGLININTASWRVLSAIQWIPKNVTNDAGVNAGSGNKVFSNPYNIQNLTYNEYLAKCIVYCRDVDDGMGTGGVPHPHGPFKSIDELNIVVDPTSYNGGTSKYDRTFQNAMGLIDTTKTVNGFVGNFACGTLNITAAQRLQVEGDWTSKFLMVNRASNLITLRSDAFTVYMMVQGWRNVNTSYPELVIQKRAAFLIDRSRVTPSSTASGARTFTIDTQ